jgi:hypothetical protein
VKAPVSSIRRVTYPPGRCGGRSRRCGSSRPSAAIRPLDELPAALSEMSDDHPFRDLTSDFERAWRRPPRLTSPPLPADVVEPLPPVARLEYEGRAL